MQDMREKQSLSFIIAFSTYPVINIVSMYILYYVYVFFFASTLYTVMDFILR